MNGRNDVFLTLFPCALSVFEPKLLNFEVQCLVGQYCYQCKTLLYGAMAQGQFYQEHKEYNLVKGFHLLQKRLGWCPFSCFSVMTLWSFSHMWSSL